ncbi:MAG TPA: SRPBCC family protein [Polyangiales bacterium]|nr:SRPBCC family protein [Polyangiales bacterium]
MIVGIGIGVSLAVATIVVRVSRQPAAFRIERSTLISAKPQDVFPLVNDFHNWPGWSPWAKLDPKMVVTYDGPASGVGASYAWIGNKKVGSGRMTIEDSQAARRVGLQLQFFSPLKATNMGEFKFEPAAQGTRVTWTMTGTRDFVAKLFAFFVDIEKMVGGDFEKGLAAMKAIAESKPASPTA